MFKFEEYKVPEEKKEEEIEKKEEKIEEVSEEEKALEFSEEEKEIISSTEEIKDLYNKVEKGELEIGEIIKKIDKYKEVNTSNPKPKKIEMRTVVDYRGIKAEGAILNLKGVQTTSPEFKEYIESNTKIKEFLGEFYDGDRSYRSFKLTLDEYEEEFAQYGFRVCYYKFGVSGDRPQRLTLEVFGDKAKKYKEEFFGEEENYDEKLELFERKQELINDFSKNLERLKEFAEIDKKLILLKEITDMNSEDLKKYFNVKSLYLDYDSIKDVISVMINSDLKKDDIYVQIGSYSGVENDNPVYKPKNNEFLNDQDAVKLWVSSQKSYPNKAVKVYSTGITVAHQGKMKSIEFPPYMEYEDFEGGQTYRYNENDVSKILDVKEEGKEIKVIYLDGNQVKKEKSF